MILKQWFGLCQCMGGPCILLSPAGLTAAFKATLEMTGEQVSCQLGCQVRKREGGGCGGGRKMGVGGDLVVQVRKEEIRALH